MELIVANKVTIKEEKKNTKYLYDMNIHSWFVYKDTLFMTLSEDGHKSTKVTLYDPKTVNTLKFPGNTVVIPVDIHITATI